MELEHATLWWLAAGALVAAELLSGSFYLLMLALGASAGALCAHLGLAAAGQLLAAAAAGMVAALTCYLVRKRSRRSAPDDNNPIDNLDLGASVMVAQWQADGTAQVRYRGAQWTAIAHPAQTAPAPGLHRVAAVVGNRLLLEPNP